MSFPDFGNQDEQFEEVEENQNQQQVYEENEQGFTTSDFIALGDSKVPEQSQQNENFLYNMGGSDQIDDEEQLRIQKREEEEAERRRKITEKMDLELKGKNEKKEKALEFMADFEKKRGEVLKKRKDVNIKNENDNLENKKLMKEGKKNQWETVVENIEIKESNYKGTKDVSRMRAVILNRKNDSLNQQNE